MWSISICQSLNELNLEQTAQEALQEVQVEGAAETIVTSEQVVHPVIEIDIQQDCFASHLCVEDAVPEVVTDVLQAVTASSANIFAIDQQSQTGSQLAVLTGSALTVVEASQLVDPDVFVEIALECSVDTGACAHIALPTILTIATQVINAESENIIDVTQQTDTGASQVSEVDANAETQVYAEQIVTPTAMIDLVQICKVDIGICIQDALPLIQTLAQQIVNAHADNTVDITQVGAETQSGSITGSAQVAGEASQVVETIAGVNVEQRCDIKKGACIQVLDGGKPTCMFTGGQTTEFGEYNGDLDTHAFDNGLTRQNVTGVAVGLCPSGEGLCPRARQLVLWIFGPEPEPVPGFSTFEMSNSRIRGNGIHTKRRGKQTNVVKGMIHFLANRLPIEESVAEGTFGGGVSSQISSEAQAFMCSMQRGVPRNSNGDVWDFAAEQIAAVTSSQKEWIIERMRNAGPCNQMA